MGKKPKAEPVKIRIKLPLEADVASTLIKVVGRTYPRTMIGTPEADMYRDKELVLLIDQRDRHKSAKSKKKYEQDRDCALGAVESLTRLDPSGVSVAPHEALAKTWVRLAVAMFEANPDAVNYLEATVFHKETRESYVFWCAKSEGQTPHALRQAAEKRAEDLEVEVAELQVRVAKLTAEIARIKSGPSVQDLNTEQGGEP